MSTAAGSGAEPAEFRGEGLTVRRTGGILERTESGHKSMKRKNAEEIFDGFFREPAENIILISF